MAEQHDMNQLLRAAVRGVSEEELVAQLAERRKPEKVKDMNALLRAARGMPVTDEEGNTDAA